MVLSASFECPAETAALQTALTHDMHFDNDEIGFCGDIADSADGNGSFHKLSFSVTENITTNHKLNLRPEQPY